MSVTSPETFLSLLAKTLTYFTSVDEVNPTEEEKWVQTVALLDYHAPAMSVSDHIMRSLALFKLLLSSLIFHVRTTAAAIKSVISCFKGEPIRLTLSVLKLIHGLNPFLQRKDAQTLPSDKILNLLRESLLTQRWEEVLKIITVISEHRKMNYTVFKVGLELCHHLEPCRGRYLEQLILHLLGPTALCPRLVTLEYVLFLLSISLDSPDIEAAATVFQTFKKPLFSKKQESEQMILMFEAYKGFIWYVLWQQSKNKVEQLKAQLDTNFIEEVELSHEENKMKILCERALLSLQLIQDKPGIWDIFITKYADLLEWSGEIDEVELILKTYQKNNPSYPNAHRYLYNYYKKHGNTDDILPVLEKLCELLPAENYVLELVAHHKHSNALPDVTMPLLFNLLDYPCWKDSPEPWNLLAEDLIQSLEGEANDSTAETFQSCWSSRYSWWPSYHFNKHSLKGTISTADGKKLIASKASVAIIFDIAVDYVNKARELLSDADQCASLLDKATKAARHLTIESSDT